MAYYYGATLTLPGCTSFHFVIYIATNSVKCTCNVIVNNSNYIVNNNNNNNLIDPLCVLICCINTNRLVYVSIKSHTIHHYIACVAVYFTNYQ